MIICYLLESANLSGGVRVVFDQARALQLLGHHLIIRAKEGNHHWYPYSVPIEYVEDLGCAFSDGIVPDVVIATFWTTVKPALFLGCSKTFHFCQGYEGDTLEYAAILSSIEDIYRIPIPKITLGPWLSARLVEKYGTSLFPVLNVGQIVDVELFHPPLTNVSSLVRSWLGYPANIMVVGMFESSVKAIPCALTAVELLRKMGEQIHLIRVSPNPQHSDEKKITQIDEYYSAISPLHLAKLYQRCDVYLSPSLAHEGFGLPFAEALASGVPAVATAIPSSKSFDAIQDYACFVPQNDPEKMAQAAHDILHDRKLSKKLRHRGAEVVRKYFRAELVAHRLDTIFQGKAAL